MEVWDEGGDGTGELELAGDAAHADGPLLAMGETHLLSPADAGVGDGDEGCLVDEMVEIHLVGAAAIMGGEEVEAA